MPPEQLLLEKRDVPSHRIQVFPECKECGVSRRERPFNRPEVGLIDVVVEAQAPEDLIHRQMRQDPVGEVCLRVPLHRLSPRERVHGAEESGRQLIDAENRRLRLVVRDRSKQASVP